MEEPYVSDDKDSLVFNKRPHALISSSHTPRKHLVVNAVFCGKGKANQREEHNACHQTCNGQMYNPNVTCAWTPSNACPCCANFALQALHMLPGWSLAAR